MPLLNRITVAIRPVCLPLRSKTGKIRLANKHGSTRKDSQKMQSQAVTN